MTEEIKAKTNPVKKIAMFFTGCCIVPVILLIIIIAIAATSPSKTYSEQDLQAKFDRIVEQSQKQQHLNPAESITIDLHDGFADLTMNWEDGQVLTAKVVEAESGDKFDLQDVNVEGTAAILDELTENISEEVIESILEEFIKGHIKDVGSIQIMEDELTLFYR